MNVLSLFSGIGGLDLGLQRAGMTIVGQVEIDPWCRRVLAKHWPEVPRHDDVRTCVQWWGNRPSPDLICGGFPCQPVSFAGKRRGQDDERWLWPAMADTIRRLQPAYVLVENVPGLLVRGMGDVLGDLAACGYDAEWDCIPASAVGAPHRRDRVWIVAHATELLSDGSDSQPGRQVPEPGDRRGTARTMANANGSRTRADTSGSRAASPAGTGDGTQRRGQSRPDFSGGSPAVADPEGKCGELRQATGARPGRPASSRHAMADAASQGPPDGRTAPGRRPGTARRVEPQRLGRPLADTHREPLGWPPIPRGQRDQWPVEPGVGRVAHGIPARVDRLRGLGNAVVPQVAEHIGHLIMQPAS